MSGLRFDIENQLSVGQKFDTASDVSTHSYQKQTAAQDLSIGRRMALLVTPTVAADGGATYTLEAIQADDAALTSNVEILSAVTAVDADLALGKEIEIPIPQGSMDKQFIGFRCKIAGGSSPEVTLDVYFMPQDEITEYKSFPKVINVDV